jgi:hypothetical protein
MVRLIVLLSCSEALPHRLAGTPHIDVNLSQHLAIVSRVLVIFPQSAFLTKFTPGLTSFSRAWWSSMHDPF